VARYASAKIAIAECDICGFRYKLKELRNLIEKGRDTNIKACPECWNPDQPQLRLGEFPIDDPQAVKDPRPDFAGYESSRNIQWGWEPVGNGNNPFELTINDLVGTASVGSVTVTVT
jgi:hypothetical protein|tara:strand:- start:4601 stop:4951 length:351 start_codon:yes stop_codon:yes gene_type:complete